MFKDCFIAMNAFLKTAEVAEYLSVKHKYHPADAFNERYKFLQAKEAWKKKRAKAFALVVSCIKTKSFTYQIAEPFIKSDQNGEKLLPMLRKLCDILAGDTTMGFMSLLERMNDGWTPSAEQSSMDILPFIEEQYKLSEDLSKFRNGKQHEQSEQVRFGTVLV